MMFGNYLFNLRPGVLITTLSLIWGKLNLPTLLFRVGLLILINMDSLIYLDKWCPSLPINLKLLWLMGGWFGYDDEWVRDPSGVLCIFH